MSRFVPLIRREWIIARRDMVINAIIVFLVLLASEVLQSVAASYSGFPFPPESYGRIFIPFLLVGGILLASMLFNQDLFKKENQHTFLMLPATGFEKFSVKALLIIVGYPVALIALFVLSSFVIEVLVFLLFGNPIRFFNPFALKGSKSLVQQYWVATSFFIFGATLFRKSPFIKTAILALSLLLTTVALGFLLTRLFVSLRFGGAEPFFSTVRRVNNVYFTNPSKTIRAWLVVSKILVVGVLPLGGLGAAYLRVGEVEAIDAV